LKNLTLFNGSTNTALVGGFNSGSLSASITWTATFSGLLKVVYSVDRVLMFANAASSSISLVLNSVGNTLDSQNTFGTNQWVGHVYNHSDGPPPEARLSTSPSTTQSPFCLQIM
jgi:hypothetical protein